MSRKLLTAGAVVSLLLLGLAPMNAAAEETGNNLSVPAIYVGTVGVGSPTCTADDDTMPPTGTKGVLVGDTLEYTEYYVQGVASWQADCDLTAEGPVTATAEWGDNLTGAPLKQGTPIRTEIGFLADPATYAPMTGYEVVKLDPTMLDREAPYGTLGVPSDFTEIRVWSRGTTLMIQEINPVTGVALGAPVYSGDYSAEVNSTGRIVYGYNWTDPAAGTYLITVSAPDLHLTGTDAGDVVSPTSVTIEVDVALTAGGGGGGGGGGKPTDPPGGGGGGKPDSPGGGGGGGGPRGPR